MEHEDFVDRFIRISIGFLLFVIISILAYYAISYSIGENAIEIKSLECFESYDNTQIECNSDYDCVSKIFEGIKNKEFGMIEGEIIDGDIDLGDFINKCTKCYNGLCQSGLIIREREYNSNLS